MRDPTLHPRADPERRQITALSCELIGAAGRADGGGLEDLRDAIAAFQRCVSGTVDRHGGFVVDHLGNAALVLFGYPVAQEHDAEQAVRAGLALCAAVGTARPGAGAPLQCRVGITTGMAIIGDLGPDGAREHPEIVGDAPNLAMRLRLSAQPGIVAIDPVTRRLIGGLFDCRDLGTINTADGTEPVRTWKVLGETVTMNRFEALRGPALVRLVGREEETSLLLRLWSRAMAGEGQALVSGEAGLGESRLTVALEERLNPEPHFRLRYFCSPRRRPHRRSAVFVEELTKSVLESGLLRAETDRYVIDGLLPPLAIPTSLYASLLARLDRQKSARLAAQIGAAIGREFTYGLLRAVWTLSEDELQTALARLVASELVYQRSMPPDAVYSFKHALVRDAAYGSLLRGSRRKLHALIAEALQAHSGELMETQPELFAWHYAEAGLVEKSISFWAKAGQRSAARSALAEAAAQYQKGLDQLALLPGNPERLRQQLEFCSALGSALRAVKGLAAPETGQAYAQAQQVWEQLGSPSEFAEIPFGLSRYHAYRGEFDLALRLDEDLLHLSRQRNDLVGLVLGHLSSGRNLMYYGRLNSSRSHLEDLLGIYDPPSHRSVVNRVGFYPQGNSQACLAVVLLCLGYPDQALAQSNAAVAAARSVAHLHSLVSILAMAGVPLSLVGDPALLGEWADQLVAITTEQGFPAWCAIGTTYRGWVKVKNGDIAAGISLLRNGTMAFRATGAELFAPFLVILLASACENAGQVEESLTLLAEALQIVERTGERWLAAELNRQKGELLLRQGNSAGAEELYRKALTIAAEQGAKFWELRAAASLARLRREQGRHAEARDVLAPIYGWFTEGFNTADLNEAKALLDELT